MHPDAQEATELFCLTWLLLAKIDPNLIVAEKAKQPLTKY